MNARWVAAVLVVLAANGCRLVDPAPAAPAPPTGGESVGLTGLPWLRLDDHPKVSAHDKNAAPSEVYNRDRDWMPDGWTDPDHNGCTTREDILIRDSLDPMVCAHSKPAGVGRWPLVYVTGVTSSPRDLEIDHVASLGDAWRSGGWAWPVERMRQYAQDPQVLWAVSGPANRAKSDDGPGTWKPANRAVWCELGRRYANAKAAYDLSVTSADLAGLRDLRRGC